MGCFFLFQQTNFLAQPGRRILQRVRSTHGRCCWGTWPVDPLVWASGAHARLDGAGEAEADVAEAAVPAPAHGTLLVYGAILHEVKRKTPQLADWPMDDAHRNGAELIKNKWMPVLEIRIRFRI